MNRSSISKPSNPKLGTLLFSVSLIVPIMLLGADRPRSVSAGARYLQRSQVWVLDHGDSRTVWYKDGTRKAAGPYHSGKRTGDWKFWYPNGELKGTGRFVANRLEGVWNLYYENGELQARGTYKDNRRNGSWIFYYPRGIKKSQATFKNGYPHGVWTEYYENGKIYYQGQYRKSQEHGKWDYYTETGKLVQSGKFRRGVRIGTWYICAQGHCGRQTFKTSDIPPHSGRIPDYGKPQNTTDVLKFLNNGR